MSANTIKRLTLAGILLLGVPYSLIYIFNLSGDIVVGKITAISFVFVVAVVFLTYQIFFVPAATGKQVMDSRVSSKTIRKFDLLFRAALFLFLVGLVYLEVAPFSMDAYDRIVKNRQHVIEGVRYGRSGNILIDQFVADDGELYQYPYSIQRIKPSHRYSFEALPRSRLVLTVVGEPKGIVSK